jgi:hypothetical protein
MKHLLLCSLILFQCHSLFAIDIDKQIESYEALLSAEINDIDSPYSSNVNLAKTFAPELIDYILNKIQTTKDNVKKSKYLLSIASDEDFWTVDTIFEYLNSNDLYLYYAAQMATINISHNRDRANDYKKIISHPHYFEAIIWGAMQAESGLSFNAREELINLIANKKILPQFLAALKNSNPNDTIEFAIKFSNRIDLLYPQKDFGTEILSTFTNLYELLLNEYLVAGDPKFIKNEILSILTNLIADESNYIRWLAYLKKTTNTDLTPLISKLSHQIALKFYAGDYNETIGANERMLNAHRGFKKYYSEEFFNSEWLNPEAVRNRITFIVKDLETADLHYLKNLYLKGSKLTQENLSKVLFDNSENNFWSNNPNLFLEMLTISQDQKALSRGLINSINTALLIKMDHQVAERWINELADTKKTNSLANETLQAIAISNLDLFEKMMSNIKFAAIGFINDGMLLSHLEKEANHLLFLITYSFDPKTDKKIRFKIQMKLYDLYTKWKDPVLLDIFIKALGDSPEKEAKDFLQELNK